MPRKHIFKAVIVDASGCNVFVKTQNSEI